MRVKSEEEIIIEVCKGQDYKTVLENGTPQQQYKLAGCFANAFMYIKLHNLCIKLYKKAADAGHVEAAFIMYSYTRAKIKTALKYLKFAAEKGHVNAKLELARCYVFRNYSPFLQTTSEEKKGFEIVKELADKKIEGAYYILATCYETGRGTDMDLEKAKKYYKLQHTIRNHDERIDMLIRERDKPNKKTRKMIVKKYPRLYAIEDDKLVAIL